MPPWTGSPGPGEKNTKGAKSEASVALFCRFSSLEYADTMLAVFCKIPVGNLRTHTGGEAPREDAHDILFYEVKSTRQSTELEMIETEV